MDTGRFLQRKGYRKLWEDMLVLTPNELPLSLFLSVAESVDEAKRMHYDFNASMHRKGV